MLSYSLDDGCLEAIAFGFKAGLLKHEEYQSLSQCETLEDVKTVLTSSDYGNFLQNESILTSRTIGDAAMERTLQDFNELRTNSVQPLSQFLDFLTAEYMIQNTLKLISGIKHGKEASDLLCKCHPLGIFPAMAALVGQTSIEDMYETVLIDSPLRPFFQRTSKKDFDELSIEYIRGTLQKNWLEQFYEYCEGLGGLTAEVMCDMLEYEADRLVITISLNTRDVKDLHADDKKKLFPRFGKLADLHDSISECETDDDLREKIRAFPEYAAILEGGSGTGLDTAGSTSIERRFPEGAMTQHRYSLGQQHHYGVFYSWLKLKEQEVANIQWLCECITQGMKHRTGEYVAAY
jgi:V-type H+-transporting ATPase subunit d